MLNTEQASLLVLSFNCFSVLGWSILKLIKTMLL